METVLIILAIICFILGIIGSIVPLLPGPVLSYVGLILLAFTNVDITANNLIVCGIIIAIIIVLDFTLGPVLARKSGGSRSATVGSMVGIILCFFVFPLSVFIGAFFGAYIGELIHDSSDHSKALKVGFFSFLGFLCGVMMEIMIAIYILYIGFIEIAIYASTGVLDWF